MDEVSEVLRETVTDVRNAEDRLDYLGHITGATGYNNKAVQKAVDDLAGRLSQIRVELQLLLSPEEGQ